MENLTLRPRLLFGYGDIGQRLGNLSLKENAEVLAIRRSKVENSNVETLSADVTKTETIKHLTANNPMDIVVTLTPTNYSEQGYRDSYLACTSALAEVLPTHSPQSRVIFVSSTSTYGQSSGEWVTERSDCAPNSATAKVLIEAENALSASGISHCNLRFSGIYGPGRTRMIDTTRALKIAPSSPTHWTNRIHADDCAAVLDFLLRLPEKEMPSRLIGTDCTPVAKRDVQLFIAEKLGMDIPREEGEYEGEATATGKRCSNQKLLDLGYNFLYPGYREGFSALLY